MKHYTWGNVLGFILIACNSTAIDSKLPDVPESVATMQFYGDSRESPQMYSGLLEIGYSHFPKGAIIHLGDMISSPSHPEQYKPFAALTHQYTNKDNFYITLGNHDVDNAESLVNASRVFPEIGPGGYYAKTIGNCFCIFLNSEDLSVGANGIGAEQKAWLIQTLESEASENARYRFVMIHRPLYPQNQHRDDPLKDADELHALFVSHNIQMVVAGHEHSYSHQVKDSIHYLITGGGGSPLFKGGGTAAFFHYVQMFELQDELKFYVIDFLERTKDEFEIALPPL